jgi:exosortase
MANASQRASLGQGLRGIQHHQALWQFLALFLLVGWLYSSILYHLFRQWLSDADASYGLFVPIFCFFVFWRDRKKIAKTVCKPSASGLPIITLALFVLIIGVLGAELFLSRVSLLLLLAGLVVFFQGWPRFKAALFPYLLLFLMVPVPAIVLSRITFPLQLIASKIAALMLVAVDIPVLREGNIIHLASANLDVAEACSGIRSLLSLTTLSVIYGYFMESSFLTRVSLVSSSIAIAVLVNSLRIVATGVLIQYWDPGKALGFFHIFAGYLMFLVSMVLLFLFHKSVQGISRRLRRTA